MGVYSIYLDGELMYTSQVTSLEYALSDIQCTLSIGEEGSAEFKVPPTNCRYAFIHRMKSRVKIFDDDYLLFSGRVVESNMDADMTKEVSCEGDLALLLDSIHGPFKSTNTSIRTFLQNAITSHNSQVEDWKHFGLGNVTVDGVDTPISFDVTGYSGTKEVLSSQIIDKYGGYFQTRIGTVTERTPKGNEPFTTELKSGSRGTAVRTLQSRINGLELDGESRPYSCGSVDGIFGSNTRSGVLGFQQDEDLLNKYGVSPRPQANGIYDKVTHEALMAVLNGGYNETVSKDVILLDYLADPYYSTQEESISYEDDTTWNAATDRLAYGSRGEKVRLMQERLLSLGSPYDNHGYVKANGNFDAYTQWSVSRFQTDNGLKRTMMYDKETHEKLMQKIAEAQSVPYVEPEETTEIAPTNLQSIHFGVNLVDVSGEYPIDDIFTVLLPIGENDITIADVNDGSLYLENADAIKEFGRIVKTFTWSKANSKEALKAYAEEYLKSHTMVFPDNLTVTALDMHLLDESSERIHLGDWISVVSEPHGINQVLCVLEIEYDLQDPGATQYELGYYIPSNFDSDTSERRPVGSSNKNSKKTASKAMGTTLNKSDLVDQALAALGLGTKEELGDLATKTFDYIKNHVPWNSGG